MKKPVSKNAAKEALAKGAEKLRKAQAQAAGKPVKPVLPPKPGAKKTGNPPTTDGTVTVVTTPLKLVESKRPIEEILAERVKFINGNTSLVLAKDTPIEESLKIADYIGGLAEHIGYLWGDLVNACGEQYGGKFAQAMAQTGRSYAALANNAHVARNIPPALRSIHPQLTYSFTAEVVKLTDEDKKKVLEEAAAEIKAGKKVTKMDIRNRAKKYIPKPKKTPKKPAKPSKKPKNPAPEAYKPTAEEAARFEDLSERLDAIVTDLQDEPFVKVLLTMDNKAKMDLLKVTKPIADFHNKLDAKTGYVR